MSEEIIGVGFSKMNVSSWPWRKRGKASLIAQNYC